MVNVIIALFVCNAAIKTKVANSIICYLSFKHQHVDTELFLHMERNQKANWQLANVVLFVPLFALCLNVFGTHSWSQATQSLYC